MFGSKSRGASKSNSCWSQNLHEWLLTHSSIAAFSTVRPLIKGDWSVPFWAWISLWGTASSRQGDPRAVTERPSGSDPGRGGCRGGPDGAVSAALPGRLRVPTGPPARGPYCFQVSPALRPCRVEPWATWSLRTSLARPPTTGALAQDACGKMVSASLQKC